MRSFAMLAMLLWSSAVLANDLVFEARSDKPRYAAGETPRFVLTLKNTGSRTITLCVITEAVIRPESVRRDGHPLAPRRRPAPEPDSERQRPGPMWENLAPGERKELAVSGLRWLEIGETTATAEYELTPGRYQLRFRYLYDGPLLPGKSSSVLRGPARSKLLEFDIAPN